MERSNMYQLGDIWENPYVRHLGITDHIRELAAIDDELRREKNRMGKSKEGIQEIERHFQNELADLVLIALKDLDPDLLRARERKFLEKAAQKL